MTAKKDMTVGFVHTSISSFLLGFNCTVTTQLGMNATLFYPVKIMGNRTNLLQVNRIHQDLLGQQLSIIFTQYAQSFTLVLTASDMVLTYHQ